MGRGVLNRYMKMGKTDSYCAIDHGPFQRKYYSIELKKVKLCLSLSFEGVRFLFYCFWG